MSGVPGPDAAERPADHAAGPRLSVVVPTYRATDQLAALLASLARQVYRDAEVVIVDDGTPAFRPRDWQDRCGGLPTTVLHFDQNRGRAAVRNAGIAAARGELVVFLDGDMTADAGLLAAHAAFHDRHCRAVAVGAIRWGEGVPDTAVTRYAVRRGVARYQPGPVPFKCFVTGNASVPRTALEDLGGFDPGFSTYGGEDLDLGYRLHRGGWTIHAHPEALSWHHGWRDLEGMCAAMAAYGATSLPHLLERHPELAEVLRLDLLEGPAWAPRRWAAGLALTGVGLGLLRRLARWGEARRAPDLLLSGLWWAERTSAYRRATTGRG